MLLVNFQKYQKIVKKVDLLLFFINFDKNQQNPNKQRDLIKKLKTPKPDFPIKKRAKKCKNHLKNTLILVTMDWILTLFWTFENKNIVSNSLKKVGVPNNIALRRNAKKITFF